MDPADTARAMPTTDLSVEGILTKHLDDDALEELIFVYLQNRFGYLMRNGTPRAADYAYVLRNLEGDEALVHACAGDAPVARDADSLPTDVVDDWFVFSPTNTYGPDPAPNVHEIDPDDVIDFIRGEPWSLPLSVSRWIERAVDEELVCGCT